MTNRITVCFWGLWYLPGCSIVGKNRWRSKLCQSLAGETDVVCKPSFQLTSPKFYRNIWDHSVVSNGFKGTSNVFIRKISDWSTSSLQASHRNAVQTALSSTQTLSIVLPKLRVPGSVHYKQTTKLDFMNLRPGSTVGMLLSFSSSRLWMINYMFKVCSSWHCIFDTAYGWKCDEF